NVQSVMNSIRRAWWHQSHISYRARHPRVTLVDRISMFVELEAAVEVGARFDRTAPSIVDFAAVKNCLPLVVYRLQLDPNIERVDCSSRKKVPDFSCSYYDFDAHRIAPTNGRVNFIERGYNFDRRRDECLPGAEVR